MDIHTASTNNFANICIQVLCGCLHFSWAELLGHVETPFEKLLEYYWKQVHNPYLQNIEFRFLHTLNTKFSDYISFL